MITITDNGNGSFAFVKSGVTSLIQNALVSSISANVDSVFIICKGGKTYKVDNYTEVSGQASAEALVQFIEGMVNVSCPAISIGSLTGDIEDGHTWLGEVVSITAPVTGGTGPYTFAVTSGSLPSGLSLTSPNTELEITGTPDVFALGASFTITVTDANGCPGSQAYTIDVYGRFTILNQPIDPGINLIPISVSGINATYAAGNLVSCELNINWDTANAGGIQLYNPDASECGLFGGSISLSGANFSGTTFYNHNITDYPFIETGTAPYTGNWKDYASESGPSVSFDSAFDGQTNNGDWNLQIQNFDGPTTLDSATLIFKPI